MVRRHPLTKTGPKRRRRTRRELPEGQFSQWRACVTHFKREREAKRVPRATDWEG